MARTAFTAPAHIVLQRRAPGNISDAPDSAPSLSYAGTLGLMDHRMTWNKYNALGNGAAAMCIGWLPGTMGYVTYDGTPPAASSTNIALAQNVPTGGVLTLTAGTGVTTNSNPFVSLPFLNTIPTGTLCIGTLPKYCFVGSRDISAYYDPTSMLGLAVRIAGSSGAAGQVFTVRGYDVYGAPMSEQITAPAGSGPTNGKKAFKWITSVTGTSAEAQDYSVGTTLIAGFSLAVDTAPYASVSAAAASFTVPATFVAALTSAVPSATTADVRGTCVVANSATVIQCAPSVYRLTNTTSGTPFTEAPTPLFVGLFGQPQFTS